MRTLVISLAALTTLFAVAPASANGIDPRIVGAIMQPVMQMMHQRPHYRPRPHYYHGGPPPGACGSAYVGNPQGGTVYANLPDCDLSRAYTGPFPYRRNWVSRPATIRGPAYGGGYYGGGGEYGGGFSRGHRRVVIIHRTHREWQRTVHMGGSATRTFTQGGAPAAVSASDVAILRSAYGE